MRLILVVMIFSGLIGCSKTQSELASSSLTFSVVCEGKTSFYNVLNGKDVFLSTAQTDKNIINFKEGRVLDDDFECDTWDDEKITCEKLIDAEELIYLSKFTINRKTGSINWVTEDKDDNLKQHTKEVFEGICK